MLNLVSSLIPVVSKVIDKALPDPKEQAKAKLLITKELQNAEFSKYYFENLLSNKNEILDITAF